MKYFRLCLLSVFFVFLFSSCSNHYSRRTFNYPVPVDTNNKIISEQVKKIYSVNGIFVDNLFDGARMNDFVQIDDTSFQVNIEPENFPINDSPWFSFRIWSDTSRVISLKLNYIHGHHRYIPKISFDRIHWKKVEDSLINIAEDRRSAIFKLQIDKKKKWISAEEIINSTDVKSWLTGLKKNELASEFMSIGKTKMGRDLPFFRIGMGKSEGKKVIVLLSRQHPPEISGFLAMQSFISELLNKNKLTSDFFKKFDIWVFPLLNPDGVDLGHWRHNSNGVDLNRDWAFYRQKEVDLVTKYIVERAKSNKSEVVLGIDFHSTQKDVYYIFDDSFKTKLHNFIKHWLSSIDRLVYPFLSVPSPEPMSKPYSKVWFYRQFNAESITYEVGDETPRDTIDKKAGIAAITMMDLLINPEI